MLSFVYKFICNIFTDNVPGTAAETAFYLLLSLFPLVLFAASIIARFELNVDYDILGQALPQPVLEVVQSVLDKSAAAPTTTTSTILPIFVSVWSASAGIWALMRGVCVSHTGKRPSFVKGRAVSIFIMFGFMLMIVVSMGLWIYGQELFDWLTEVLPFANSTLVLTRYGFTTMLLFTLILLIYAATPGFKVRKRYMSVGALFAALGWELVSWAFEIYIARFSNYSTLYGGIGAFIGLAVWLLGISLVILLGAELNALIVEYTESKHPDNISLKKSNNTLDKGKNL